MECVGGMHKVGRLNDGLKEVARMMQWNDRMSMK